MKTFKEYCKEDVPANSANATALGFDPNTPSQTPVGAGVNTSMLRRKKPVLTGMLKRGK